MDTGAGERAGMRRTLAEWKVTSWMYSAGRASELTSEPTSKPTDLFGFRGNRLSKHRQQLKWAVHCQRTVRR